MLESKRAAAWPGKLLFLLPLLLIFAVSGCGSSKYGSLSSPKNDEQLRREQEAQAAPNTPAPNKVIKTAFSQVGKSYSHGGTAPETGFDCSGFVKWVYGQYNIALPRTSGDMMATGTPVERTNLEPGDLVFFAKNKRISHVGIYTGENKFIHSPRTGKPVQESDLDSRGRGEYYVGARRVLDDSVLNGISDETKQRWIVDARRQIAAEKPQLVALVGDIPSADTITDTDVAPTADQPKMTLAEVTGTITAPLEEAPVAIEENQTIPVITLASIEESLTDPLGQTLANDEENQPTTVVAATSEEPAPAKAKQPQAVVVAKAEPAAVASPTVKSKPAATTPSTVKAKPATAKVKDRKHKVASGDTLYGLARKYGTSAAAIAKANNLLDDKQKSNLKLGQLLIVPVKTN